MLPETYVVLKWISVEIWNNQILSVKSSLINKEL